MRKQLTSRRIWLGIFLVALAAGIYLLLNILAPNYIPSNPVSAQEQLQKTTPATQENRLYIPTIGVNVAIVEGTSEAVLEKGAWHRQPQNGNPEKGGNFVLSAHRFQLGLTPQQTSAKSPFYHIEQLKAGDKISVDYGQKRYTYEVVKRYQVDRFAVHIEAPSAIAKLTLYSCDLRGEAMGREVVEAKPLF